MSRISYKSFHLPFLKSPAPDLDAGDEEDGNNLDSLMREVPPEAIYLGCVDSSMGNWCEWKVEDYFYLIPWAKTLFTWALFRITWEDNWLRFEWNSVARITGVSDSTLASKRLLRGTFRKWKVDLRKRDYEPYKTLLLECGA